MKVLLVPDKFKDSLTAETVIAAMRTGVKKAFSEAEIYSVLASDGGEGFLQAILANIDCDAITIETLDPLKKKIEATYLFDTKNHTAYIELAKASGLELLSEQERNVMQTCTLGTGLLIKDAILKGATSIYLGLGGSATNDAGLGIAAALGYYFLDSDKNELKPVGSNLSKVNSIHKKRNAISLKGISFFAVNDVDNPLYGKNGSAYSYAKQKGASDSEIVALDDGLKHIAKSIKQQSKKDVAECAGSGSAGGAAYGLKVFCDAKFISGVDFILKLSKTNELLVQNKFDYIITGEGKFDSQTLHGKLVKGIIGLGKQFDVPVLVVCGQLDIEPKILQKFHKLTVIEIRDASQTLAENMKNPGMLIEERIASFFEK